MVSAGSATECLQSPGAVLLFSHFRARSAIGDGWPVCFPVNPLGHFQHRPELNEANYGGSFSKRMTMKLRFEVDPAERFRNGDDCLKSVVTIEVNHTDLHDGQRTLITEHLQGIDIVAYGVSSAARKICVRHHTDGRPVLIRAKTPTLSGLLEAIQANNATVENELQA